MQYRGSGAIGLMQIMEETASDISKELNLNNIDLKNPEQNIEIGTKYFRMLLDNFNRKYQPIISGI